MSEVTWLLLHGGDAAAALRDDLLVRCPFLELRLPGRYDGLEAAGAAEAPRLLKTHMYCGSVSLADLSILRSTGRVSIQHAAQIVDPCSVQFVNNRSNNSWQITDLIVRAIHSRFTGIQRTWSLPLQTQTVTQNERCHLHVVSQVGWPLGSGPTSNPRSAGCSSVILSPPPPQEFLPSDAGVRAPDDRGAAQRARQPRLLLPLLQGHAHVQLPRNLLSGQALCNRASRIAEGFFQRRRLLGA